MEIKCRAFTKKWGMVYPGDETKLIDVHGATVWDDCRDEECVELSLCSGIILGAKEVYAGDIVRSICSYNDKVEQIAIVEMVSPTEWQWGSYGNIHTALRHNAKTEIIGNIWENPELVASPAAMNNIIEITEGDNAGKFMLARDVRS